MSVRMTIAERQAFLADVRVGIVSIGEPDRGPLAVPVWYDYEPEGDLWFLTGRNSKKGALLSVGQRISLCVQTESPPYKYVSVEGPISSISAASVDDSTRPMARRYLGKEGGDDYVASSTDGQESVAVRMTPERWLTVDYGKR